MVTSNAFWLDRILEIPAVQNKIYCRWEELRSSTLYTETLNDKIDQFVTDLGEAQKRNFSRWNIIGIPVWPNSFIGNTYEEEITFMKNWLAQRLNWMDQNMLGAPSNCLTATVTVSDLESLEVFPNPFHHQIQFTLKNTQAASGQLSIFDATGKFLNQYQIQKTVPLTINTTSLSTGLYFYQLQVEGMDTVVGKIIKQ